MAYSADLRNKALNYYEQCKNISQTAEYAMVRPSKLSIVLFCF